MDVQVYGSGSSGNAYNVTIGDTSILIECGLPFRSLQKASGYTLTQMSGCLISHEHGDHAKAATDLIKNAGMRIYTSAGTAAELGIQDDYHVQILKAGTCERIGSVDVLPLAVSHDAAEPLAFYIRSARTSERLFYGSDLALMPYNLVSGVTHLMMEANYDDSLMDVGHADLNRRIMRTHMSIDAVEEWLRKYEGARDIQQIWLLHLSDERSNEAEFTRRIQALTGAEVYVADRDRRTA